MKDMFTMIDQADAEQLQCILEKVRCRFAERFPEWELHILTVQKGPDKSEQIASVIKMLEQLKSINE